MANLPFYVRKVNTVFEYLLEEYCSESYDITESIAQINNSDNNIDPKFNIKEEEKLVASFWPENHGGRYITINSATPKQTSDFNEN